MRRLLRRMLSAILVVSSLSMAAQRPARPSEKSAREFVNLVYGHVIVDSTFDFTQVFTPSLKELVDTDKRYVKGHIRKLNDDPLCGCHDSDGLQANTETITVEGRHADVSVALVLHDRQRRHIRLILIWTPYEGWRVDNISTPEVADLHNFLTNS